LANQHSKDLIPFMVKNFGKKVFFVGSNYVWPKESNKNAKVWLKEANGELLGEEYIPLGSSEFTPVLNKIRDAKPDFIFSTVVGASDIAFHKQFKQEGFKVDKMPIASLTTGEIETRAMGNEFGAGHFLSAPYFQTLAYVFKYGLERAIEKAGMEHVTPRMIRDVSGGVKVDDAVSPEGLIWIDDQNFNCWLKPKIGQCQADGSFKIVKEAPKQIAPDPYSIYPELGKCTKDGLLSPEGKLRKNVI
jgi:urea transport system substrate-binding protein